MFKIKPNIWIALGHVSIVIKSKSNLINKLDDYNVTMTNNETFIITNLEGANLLRQLKTIMQVKLFEVRDRATCILCFAINCNPLTVFPVDELGTHIATVEAGRIMKLLQHSGYYPYGPTLLFGRLDDGSDTANDAYSHRGAPFNRTMQLAHEYATIHWDSLNSGDVIDVEFNEGETTTKKESQYK